MEYAVRLTDVMENDGRFSRVRLFRGDVVLLEGPDLDRTSAVLLVGPEDRVKKVVQYLLTNKGRKGPARCYGREPGGVWRAIYAVD